jgi:hypothetical protein
MEKNEFFSLIYKKSSKNIWWLEKNHLYLQKNLKTSLKTKRNEKH